MKIYTENIELINKFINNELTESEKETVLKRLARDADFKLLYNEQLELVQGIKRAGLKQEIQQAELNHTKFKWLKSLGIVFSTIVLVAIVWVIFFNNNQPITTINREANYPKIEITESDNNIEVVEKESSSSTNSISVLEDVETEPLPIKQAVNEKPTEEPITEKAQKPVKSTTSLDSITLNNIKPVTHADLKQLYETVKKKPQIIEVNVEEETSFTLAEGTKITILKHAFVDERTNKLVRGTIQFEVTEYYKLADMLLGNLTTTSNGEPLETGGMLYIDATKNGKKLKLKHNINIEFPFSKTKPDMQLFSGEKHEDGINWIPEGNRTKSVISFETLEENIEVPFTIVENVPVFPGCQGENEELKDCFNTKMKQFLIQNFNLEIAEDLNLTGKNRINTFFKIDESGNITNIRIRASSVRLGKEMERVIKLLPKFQPALQRGKPVIVPYFMPFDIDLPGRDRQLPMVTVGSANVFEGRLNIPRDSVKTDPTNYNAYRASAYAFSSANLSWINCDRFVSGWKNKIRYKFKAKNAEGANIKMVFKSMSAILPSKTVNDEFNFGLVPKDEEVVLVAIKKDNDIFYLGIKETQIQDISELEFDFKPVTIEELKHEMITLNDLFD